MRVVVIKNEWKDEVQFLLKGMHHCPGERISGLRAYKTLQGSDQGSLAFRAAGNKIF